MKMNVNLYRVEQYYKNEFVCSDYKAFKECDACIIRSHICTFFFAVNLSQRLKYCSLSWPSIKYFFWNIVHVCSYCVFSLYVHCKFALIFLPYFFGLHSTKPVMSLRKHPKCFFFILYNNYFPAWNFEGDDTVSIIIVVVISGCMKILFYF